MFALSHFSRDNLFMTFGKLVTGLLACLLLSICCDFGNFHRGHNGDSIVAVLVGLVRWTPFFWQQNRYGMLWPYLLQWIHHPLWHLLAHQGCCIFAGLLSHLFLTGWIKPHGAWITSGLISCGLLFFLAPAHYRFDLLSSAQFITTPITLGALAWMIVHAFQRHQHRFYAHLLALFLLCLACWVNVALPFLLLPLTFMQQDFWQRGQQTDTVRTQFLLLLVAGFFGWSLMLGVFDLAYTNQGLALQMWLYSYRMHLLHLYQELCVNQQGPYLLYAWLACIVIVLGGMKNAHFHRGLSKIYLPVVSIVMTCLLYSFFVSTRLFAQWNQYAFRYMLPSALMIQIALVALVVLSWKQDADTYKSIFMAFFFAFFGALYAYGWPSIAGLRNDLDTKLGQYTENLLEADSTHFVGAYQTVWPTVFHVNWKRYEQGSRKRIWGLSNRCFPTRDLWYDRPRSQWRLAAAKGDREKKMWLEAMELNNVIWKDGPDRIVLGHFPIDL